MAKQRFPNANVSHNKAVIVKLLTYQRISKQPGPSAVYISAKIHPLRSHNCLCPCKENSMNCKYRDSLPHVRLKIEAQLIFFCIKNSNVTDIPLRDINSKSHLLICFINRKRQNFFTIKKKIYDTLQVKTAYKKMILSDITTTFTRTLQIPSDRCNKRGNDMNLQILHLFRRNIF